MSKKAGDASFPEKGGRPKKDTGGAGKYGKATDGRTGSRAAGKKDDRTGGRSSFDKKEGSDARRAKPAYRAKDDRDDYARARPEQRTSDKRSFSPSDRKAAAGGDKKPFERKPRTGGSEDRKPFNRDDKKPFEKRPWKDREAPSGDRDKKPYDRKPKFGGDREKRPFGKDDRKPFEKKPWSDRPKTDRGGATGEGDKKPYERKSPSFDDKPKRPYTRRDESDTERKPYAKKDSGGTGGEKKPYERKPRSFDDKPKRPYTPRDENETERKPYVKRGAEGDEGDNKPYERKPKAEGSEAKRPYAGGDKKTFKRRTFTAADKDEDTGVERRERRPREEKEEKPISGPMTLNKYISHSGEASRREAAEFVKQGKVRVNGELVLEPGYRIVPGDQVTLGGKKLTPQTGLVYILLNKPKGYITTTEDPEERKTVMDLVASAEVERLFPVGRLDRNTTGLILMTNDGNLAHKLAHPSYNIKKVYKVTLDKNLTRADYEKIVKGLELEDGKVQVDELAYLETRHELGLEIHSGRNRIVRRIFESLGYSVEKLDRMMYAGLTKKNLARGKWRFLTEREIVLLKHFK